MLTKFTTFDFFLDVFLMNINSRFMVYGFMANIYLESQIIIL